MTDVVILATCTDCLADRPHVLVGEDDHMAEFVCSACGARMHVSTEASALYIHERESSRWARYLAKRIGQIQGYGECSIEEHSIALEIAARKALAGPLPAAVEEQLREALDRVAETYVAGIRAQEEEMSCARG